VARAAEGWAARRAAAVGVIAEGFRPYVESLGVDATRIRRLRNWTHVQSPTVDRAAMREQLGWPADATVCLHAGSIGYKQGLEHVIECARLAAAGAPSLLFVLTGDGSQRATLARRAAAYGLSNVRFAPLQHADVFPSVLAAADILLVNQRATVRDMSLPSKLTSYFAAGRPIVAAAHPNSETAREIAASSGGIVVQPDDPRALLEGIRRVASDRALGEYLGKCGRAWASTTLSETAALRAYEQFVAAVLAAGSRGRVHTPWRRYGAGDESRIERTRDRWAA
jgi:glycosyltransferase involved in cell wall biosynthesis